MMSYINKLCRDADRKMEQKRKQAKQKKYCKDFVLGQDGYCVNYTGVRPCYMTCRVQCKAGNCNDN